MHLVVYMLAAIVIGSVVAAQPPMNAILARAIGSAFGAASVSIFFALLTSLVLVLFLGSGEFTREKLSSVPWWVYLAGPAGAFFVAGGVYIAPLTGTLIFFVCIVAGQLIGSALMDHFGAFGLDVRKFSLARLAGVLLVVAGAILVSRG